MKNIVKLFALPVLCIVTCLAADAQTALLQYTFSDGPSGTTSANTGTLGSAGNLNFYNAVSGYNSSNTADLFSADGAGVGGTGYAFDNTASTGMGNAGTGNLAQTGAGLLGTTSASVTGALDSFTIAGWFQTAGTTKIGSLTKLLALGSSGYTGITLATTSSTGQLLLYVDNSTAGAASSASYTATQSWVFFAVAYNGLATTNNVAFYVGNTSGALSLAGTATLNNGAVNLPTGTSFTIGNGTSSNGRPLDGLMDDIALYGSSTDDSGALSQLQIQAIQTSAIPEPSTVALLAGIAALGFVFIRRR